LISPDEPQSFDEEIFALKLLGEMGEEGDGLKTLVGTAP
jgi:hypothetical protein